MAKSDRVSARVFTSGFISRPAAFSASRVFIDAYPRACGATLERAYFPTAEISGVISLALSRRPDAISTTRVPAILTKRFLVPSFDSSFKRARGERLTYREISTRSKITRSEQRAFDVQHTRRNFRQIFREKRAIRY